MHSSDFFTFRHGTCQLRNRLNLLAVWARQRIVRDVVCSCRIAVAESDLPQEPRKPHQIPRLWLTAMTDRTVYSEA